MLRSVPNLKSALMRSCFWPLYFRQRSH